MKTKGRLAWHVHHDNLVEVLTEPLSVRIAYIKAEKPYSEIALRLRLLKIVRGKLPKPVMAAGAGLNKPWANWEKAEDNWEKAKAKWGKAKSDWDKAAANSDKATAKGEKAWANLKKARAKWDKSAPKRDKSAAVYQPAIERLHAKECPGCPWDGKTIFTGDA